MRKFLVILFPICVLAYSCGESRDGQNAESVDTRSKSEMIIDSAIAFHGGVKYYDTDISFGFRDKDYHVFRSANSFTYSTSFSDSLGDNIWELTNGGLIAKRNGVRIALSAKDSMAYAESLNSVVYFAMLPSLLSDNAVHSKLDGTENIKGKDYYRIEVTFSEEGGGTDHDDVYLYWLDKADYSLDYLAYSFHVNKGGSRFRAVTNSRRINGIIFQDYENYKGPAPDSLQYISEMYNADKLPLLSTIELNKISVIDRPTAVSEIK
ncbi:hypothetical protein G3O08_02635 [Cryomorpha ignava]|uniref:Deoxyribose-phosphate aldolase n=1 Tax=Cryomorpha ignava TaxID=101383 RepID=A0A7K3WLK9_9FLAO|nr:DUF6503 family protein [Cryomorpha ignava]NEN22398.1 hypothetical protein [Cryomorpha ignava]